jgi:hypothetical protein
VKKLLLWMEVRLTCWSVTPRIETHDDGVELDCFGLSEVVDGVFVFWREVFGQRDNAMKSCMRQPQSGWSSSSKLK